MSVRRSLDGRSQRDDRCDRGSGGWCRCSRLHRCYRDRGKSWGIRNVLEKGGKDGVDLDRHDDRGRGWSVCEGNRLGGRRIYANQGRGRTCVGSLTMCGEVLYGEVRDWEKGPPLTVADEGVIKRVFPVVKCVKVGTRLLFTGKKKVFGFSSSEVRRIIEIEVVACSSYEDMQTTCAVECIYLVFT